MGHPGRRYTRWLLLFAAGLGVLCAVPTSLPTRSTRASGPTGYLLYYSFNVPKALAGLTLSTEDERHKFSGTLTGTIGGLPVTSASYEYGTGASAWMGGGTFTLATPADAVQGGNILMTADEKVTTLLFFGTYLGAHLAFSIRSPQEQIGGPGVTATGLAETGLLTHEQYMDAIRRATGASTPAERDKLLQGAEQNPRLVKDYQQKHPNQ